MRVARWGFAIVVASTALAVDILTASDRLWLLVIVLLLTIGADRATSVDAALTAKIRGWKERRVRQRHTELRSDIAGVDRKVETVTHMLANLSQAAVAREDTEEAKAFRRAEYEKLMAAFHEIIALHDKASEYREMAEEAIKELDAILTNDTDAAEKVERLRERTFRYRKEVVTKIAENLRRQKR